MMKRGREGMTRASYETRRRNADPSIPPVPSVPKRPPALPTSGKPVPPRTQKPEAPIPPTRAQSLKRQLTDVEQGIPTPRKRVHSLVPPQVHERVVRDFLDSADNFSEKESIEDLDLIGHIQNFVNHVWDASERTADGDVVVDTEGRFNLGWVELTNEKMEKIFGRRLVSELKDLSSENHEYTVQDAIQTWVVYCVREALNGVLFGIDRGKISSDTRKEIASNIRKSGAQIARSSSFVLLIRYRCTKGRLLGILGGIVWCDR